MRSGLKKIVKVYEMAEVRLTKEIVNVVQLYLLSNLTFFTHFNKPEINVKVKIST